MFKPITKACLFILLTTSIPFTEAQEAIAPLVIEDVQFKEFAVDKVVDEVYFEYDTYNEYGYCSLDESMGSVFCSVTRADKNRFFGTDTRSCIDKTEDRRLQCESLTEKITAPNDKILAKDDCSNTQLNDIKICKELYSQ